MGLIHGEISFLNIRMHEDREVDLASFEKCVRSEDLIRDVSRENYVYQHHRTLRSTVLWGTDASASAIGVIEKASMVPSL